MAPIFAHDSLPAEGQWAPHAHAADWSRRATAALTGVITRRDDANQFVWGLGLATDWRSSEFWPGSK